MHPVEKVEVLRACCCVAGADGTTTDAERKVLERLADDVGVGQASLEAMIWRAENESDFYEEQFQVLKAEPRKVMLLLMQTAAADRSLAEEETVMMRKLSQRLDVPADVFDQLVERVNNKIDETE